MAISRSRWFWMALLLGVVAAGAAYVWSARAVPVEVVQVRMAPLVRTVQFSARVVALSRVDIGSTVTGRVAEVLVAEGAQVRLGSPLVRLEPQELRATLAQAVSARQQAAARLAGLRSTGRSSVQTGVTQAQAVLDASRAEFERVHQLVAQGFLSASRLDETRRQRDVAAAQLDNAKTQVRAVSDTGTEVVQAQAQLAVATAAVDAAQSRLAQTTLVAPADAQVLSRAVEPGQIVQPGRALMSLALAGPTQLVAQVDERFLDQLAVGQKASAVADAYAGQRFAARILSISPTVDAQRGSVEVKFALTDPLLPFLRQDMTLSIEVETGRRERTLALPVAAVAGLADGGQGRVRVVVNNRIEERVVQLGLRTLDAVELVAGLSEGDVVALDPTLVVGRKVRMVETPLRLLAPAKAGAGGGGAAALTNAMGR